MDIAQLHAHFLSTSGICTDSRKIKPGCMFVALKGERFDGNEYVTSAMTAGAAFAIVSRIELATADERILWVPDTLQALQQLAHTHIDKSAAQVLALTGSNGKTTTKELIREVLSASYTVQATRGNYNNHIGVPLTLLEVTDKTEWLVCEMGANHCGEIDELCHIAAPQFGLITNIGLAHLEGFGGLQGVKHGKSELYRYLHRHKGLLFVNTDEPYLQDELLPPNSRVVAYGGSKPVVNCEAYYPIRMLRSEPEISYAFEYRGAIHTGTSKLLGAYNFANIATAVAVGCYLQVPAESILERIAAYMPDMNRSQWIRRGPHRILLDAYNANPSSMKRALKAFNTLDSPHRKVAILGAMNELGEESNYWHQQLVEWLRASPLSEVILLGDAYRHLDLPKHCRQLVDISLLQEWWNDAKHHAEPLCIWVKGSRSFALETIFDND